MPKHPNYELYTHDRDKNMSWKEGLHKRILVKFGYMSFLKGKTSSFATL